MTLQASGAISLFDVNTELGLSHSAQIGLLCTNVRTLFAVASGAVGLETGYGKSNTSVPGAPTGVSASASSTSAISVSFSAPACTGHLTIDTYQVVCTSSGSNSATGSSSPISVTGLSASTSYTFKVRAHNSKGYGCYSSTASATTQSLPPYMCITTVGATVYTCCSYFTCGNVKTAVWLASGSFTVNLLGTTSGYGNRVGALFAGGGGGGSYINGGGGGGINGGIHPNTIAGIATCPSTYNIVTTKTYTVTVGGGGSGSSSCTAGNGTNSYISCFVSSGAGGGGARGQYSGHYGSSCVCASASEISNSSKTGSYVSGAGGGGASGTGSHGPYGAPTGGGQAGAGGSPSYGYTARLSGTSGGGGGGGYYNYHWSGCSGQSYGTAGGANAGVGAIAIDNQVTRCPGSATANQSGGGGGGALVTGAGGTGGSGGSGFVVLKWRYK